METVSIFTTANQKFERGAGEFFLKGSPEYQTTAAAAALIRSMICLALSWAMI